MITTAGEPTATVVGRGIVGFALGRTGADLAEIVCKKQAPYIDNLVLRGKLFKTPIKGIKKIELPDGNIFKIINDFFVHLSKK